MKTNLICALLCAILFVGCQTDTTSDINVNPDGSTVLTISTAQTRTYLGAKEGDTYPIYWSEGDRVVAAGTGRKASG